MRQKIRTDKIILFTSILIAVFMTYGQSAQARNKKKLISVTSSYSLYNDISLTSTAEKAPLAPSLEVEASFRFKSFFNFSAIIVNHFHDSDSSSPTEANPLKGYGFGFKVDLPGVFFFGERIYRYATRTSKRQPFNTFVYGNLLNLTTTETDGTNTSTVATKYGLGIDTFLFNKVAYLTLTGGGLLFDGNTYTHYGVGLGFVF